MENKNEGIIKKPIGGGVNKLIDFHSESSEKLGGRVFKVENDFYEVPPTIHLFHHNNSKDYYFDEISGLYYTKNHSYTMHPEKYLNFVLGKEKSL